MCAFSITYNVKIFTSDAYSIPRYNFFDPTLQQFVFCVDQVVVVVAGLQEIHYPHYLNLLNKEKNRSLLVDYPDLLPNNMRKKFYIIN